MIDIVDRMIKAWPDMFDSLQRPLAELQISTGEFLYIIGRRDQVRGMIEAVVAVLESERNNEPSFKIDKALADALVTLGMINWDEGLVPAGMSACRCIGLGGAPSPHRHHNRQSQSSLSAGRASWRAKSYRAS